MTEHEKEVWYLQCRNEVLQARIDWLVRLAAEAAHTCDRGLRHEINECLTKIVAPADLVRVRQTIEEERYAEDPAA